jgi:phosphotransferase system, enzyme I, PtsP
MLKKLLNIFHQISEIIADINDYDEMLSQFVEVLANGLEVDVCSVYLYNKQDDILLLKASYGLLSESVDHVTMKPGEGLTGLCFTSEKMINIVNPDKHSKYKYFANTGEEIYKSFLATPIILGREKLGVITIQSINPKRFKKTVTDSIKSVSTQLGNVIVDATVLNSLSGRDIMLKNKTVAVDKASGMLTIKGKAANIGIGIGKACIFDNENSFERIAHRETENVEEEISVLDKGIKITKQKTLTLEQKALSLISEADASIFCAHLLFLEDKTLIRKIKEDITNNKHTAEFSIKIIFDEYAVRFAELQDNIFKEKIMDLKDVMLRLLDVVKNLKRGSSIDELSLDISSANAVLVVKEILPSALIRLPVDNICGIVCEKGGVADHVAILAKALNIPAIRGIKNITKLVNDNDDIVIDGHTELIHIRPDAATKKGFKRILKSQNEDEEIQEKDTASFTKDGTQLRLNANIALISETSLLKKYGAEGIGLYRTEFLYMIRDHEPTEEDQYHIYQKVFESSDGLDITIRVLDIGGDKALPYIDVNKEDNPALGNRGVRLLLANKALFKAHLKAILRAGVYGNLKILFPMISNSQEIDQILEVLSDVETELQFQNIEYAGDYEIGVMIEVPSILFEMETVIEKVDFISLGTNDLVQYIFASDRTNEIVYNKNLYLSPVFLKILKNLGDITNKDKSKNISICGEMAGDTFALPFIIASGIKELSMAPRFIPKIRKAAKEITLEDCQSLFNEALKLSGPSEVSELVNRFYEKLKIVN